MVEENKAKMHLDKSLRSSQTAETSSSLAEKRVLVSNTNMKKVQKKLSPEEINEVLHNLEVHQLELEMQNEELHRLTEELDKAKARYFELYEMAPEGYLIISEKGLIIDANLTSTSILGATRNKILKQRISRFIFKEDEDIYYTYRRNLFSSMEPQECDIRMIRNNRKIFWAHFRASLVNNGEEVFQHLIFGDVTIRKRTEQNLIESEEKYKSLVTSMDQGLALHEIIVNIDGKPIDYRFLDINESYTRLVGVTREMCIGKTVREIMPGVEDYWIENYGKVALTGEPSYYENYFGTNGRYYSTYSYSPKKNQFAALVSDITDRMKRENEINYLNYHDHLTGVYNRRFYEEELQRLDTERNLPLTIAMGDLNGLKLTNDSFGHKVGDELLRKVGEIIQEGCRSDDIIARMGGDEFVIILPNTDSLEAQNLLERIRKLATKYKVEDLEVSISFGHATKIKSEQNINEIFKEAEDNMYRNKLYESSSIKSKTIDIIMNALYEKNHRELLHSKRVSEICLLIGKGLLFNDDDINQIKTAGLLHDIGKIGLSEVLLNGEGDLSSEDWKEIKRHPEVGYRILSSANEFGEIANFVRDHHERWDGKGYPKGLKGEEISQQARIISIADAFDAMTTERTYKATLTIEEALVEIKKNAGTQFDPKLAKLFVKIMKQQ
jgi:diguanylate cyclase (GGDEF)-like protein/PAS domain S-box-containing protein